MQGILDYIDQDKSNYYATVWNKYDIYQKIFTPHLRSELFPWVIVILALNSKNIKKPIILVLIAHFLVRYSGDIFSQIQYLLPKRSDLSWPSSYTAWYISFAVSNVIYSLGEIIGDWYPLLRTKAVTNNNKKIRIVYATCIIFNISKVLGMLCYFYDIDLSIISFEPLTVSPKIAEFKTRWWSIIALVNITSCMYDISVIYALKTCLFNRLKEFKSTGRHNFLEKFQRISEFRIVLSMFASSLFLPFVFFFVYVNVHQCRVEVCDYTVDFALENLRKVVLCLNYNFMFIDQILIRRYAERSNEKLKTMSTTSKTFASKPKSNFTDSFNHEYRTLNNSDVSEFNKFSMNSTIKSYHGHSSSGLLFSETLMNNKVNNAYNNPFVYNSSSKDISSSQSLTSENSKDASNSNTFDSSCCINPIKKESHDTCPSESVDISDNQNDENDV